MPSQFFGFCQFNDQVFQVSKEKEEIKLGSKLPGIKEALDKNDFFHASLLSF